VTLPKGTGARRRMKLRPWQKAIVHGLLDEPRPRQGLVAIPAGNGKSTLAAALGLFGLLGAGVEGATRWDPACARDTPRPPGCRSWGAVAPACRMRVRVVRRPAGRSDTRGPSR
jgi:hypothetical protein